MSKTTAMAQTRARSDNGVFPMVAAMLMLSYHALIAMICTYLPRDAMVIGYSAAGYAIVGCAVSLLGIYGIIARNRTLICLFSHFLLVDAVISTCARLLVLELFFKTAHGQDTCSDIIEAIWTDQRQPSHDTMTSLEWQRSLFQAGSWCRLALGAVHVAGFGVLVSTCAAQGTVAVAIRNFGMDVADVEGESQVVDEKQRVEERRDVKVDFLGES